MQRRLGVGNVLWLFVFFVVLAGLVCFGVMANVYFSLFLLVFGRYVDESLW